MIKRIMMSVLAFFLVTYSLVVFSQRIVLTGKPTALDLHPGFFTLPSSYLPTLGYRYITLSGTNRVCFIARKPELAGLDMVQIILQEQGKQLQWNCYQFDPRYFKSAF